VGLEEVEVVVVLEDEGNKKQLFPKKYIQIFSF